MRRAILLLVPLFLFACDRQPVAPEVSPTVDIGNAPAQTGIVVRGDYSDGYYFFDSKSNLTAFVGVDIVQFCTDYSSLENGPWADKELRDRIVTLGQGRDLQTSVWAGDFGFDCAVIEASSPVATGFADMNLTYSDLLGSAEHASTAVSITAHGILEWVGGGKAIFHAQNKLTPQKELISSVSLR